MDRLKSEYINCTILITFLIQVTNDPVEEEEIIDVHLYIKLGTLAEKFTTSTIFKNLKYPLKRYN